MIEKIFEDEVNQVFKVHQNAKGNFGTFSHEITIAFCGDQSVKTLNNSYMGSDVQQITGSQVHGSDIWDIDKNPSDNSVKCDALVTTKPQKALTILTADCLPLMLFVFRNEKPPVLLAVHCGWRSLAGGIIDAVFDHLSKHYDIDMKGEKMNASVKNVYEIGAILGPCIDSCCYYVKDDFLQAFQPLVKKYDLDINYYLTQQVDDRVSDKVSFSLLLLCQDLLMKRGVEAKSIIMSRRCTKCNSAYHSHRRNATKERNFSFIFSRNSSMNDAVL